MKLLSSVLAVVLFSSGICHPELLKGSFALQGNSPETNGYLKATQGATVLDQRLDFWMTPTKSTTPIKQYQVEMTQKLHVVLVSDDFKTFLHIHPQLDSAGHFVINQKLPRPALYHVYADGEPNKLNHQVFRFDLPVGVVVAAPRKLPPTGMGVKVGPYEVDLSTVRLKAGHMEMIDVEILKDGKPAKDLHPYLGVPAHAVFLNDKDLSYVHVHPMAMDGDMDMSKPIPELPDSASTSGEMMLHVAIQQAGTYKLWLQFRGAGNQLYVAEFTMSAS